MALAVAHVRLIEFGSDAIDFSNYGFGLLDDENIMSHDIFVVARACRHSGK